jgi:hypothetical protein
MNNEEKMIDQTEDNPGMIEVKVTKFGEIPDPEILDKKENIKEFIDQIISHSQHIMSEHSHVPPVVFFILENGDIYMLDINNALLDSDEGKDLVGELVRGLVKQKKDPSVHAVIMVSEAWFAEVKNKDQMENIKVSDHPDKQEVIMINCETRNDSSITRIPIVRVGDDVILGIPVTLPFDKESLTGKFSFFS